VPWPGDPDNTWGNHSARYWLVAIQASNHEDAFFSISLNYLDLLSRDAEDIAHEIYQLRRLH